MIKSIREPFDSDNVRLQINSLLKRTPNSVMIERKEVPQLCKLLDIENSSELLNAILVTCKPRNYHVFGSPNTILQGVVTSSGSQIDLLKLYHAQKRPDFEWAYMRFCGAKTSRAIIIQNFVKVLVSYGIFKKNQSPAA